MKGKAIQNDRKQERTKHRQPRPDLRRTGTRKAILLRAQREGW